MNRVVSRRSTWCMVLGLGLVGLAGGEARAGYVLTAEAAKAQTTGVSNVTTETFNGMKAGTYSSLSTAVGTISGPGLAVVAADLYGGAGNTGFYAAVGAQSGTTSALLTLLKPATFFGFWWSAADSLNKIEFLSNNAVVATFDSASALNSLGDSYAGNPNTGLNTGQKYAYLNVFATDNSVFDQVRFLNTNTSTGFETDNWSVSSARFTAPSSGTQIAGLSSSAVPEPSSLMMVAAGLAGVTVVGVRRRARR